MEMLKNAESIWKRAVMALVIKTCIQAKCFDIFKMLE